MAIERGLRILLVERDLNFLDRLQLALAGPQHTVEVAGDLASACARARTVQPDVVFIDVDIPVLDSAATARGIREQAAWKRPFLIALHAKDDQAPGGSPVDAAFDFGLVKSIPVDALRGLLRRFHVFVEDMESFDPMI